MQTNVIEKQVEVKGSTIDRDRNLTTNKGKSAPQFQQEIAQMDKQSTLDIPFMSRLRNGQKVEVIGIFKICPARSESEGGNVRSKLVSALPSRSWSRLEICNTRTF